MWQLLSSPLAQAATQALVHFLWQGALVAAILAIALRALGTPRLRYAASVLALLAMGILPIATCLVIEIRSSGGAVANEFRVPSSEFRVQSETRNPERGTWSGADATISWTAEFPANLTAWLQPSVLAGWLAGVLVLQLRLLSAWLGTLWLRGGRIALGNDLAVRIETLGRRLGTGAAGRVFGSPRVSEAVAVGLWRPIVLLPLSWLSELPVDVLEAVIAHELAHIRRHDVLVTWLQRVLESVLFYHPAVWWVSRQVAQAREMCCDELAVLATGRRAAYARALEMVGRRTAAPEHSLVLATSFHGDADMNLLKRVRCVLGLAPQRESGLAWSAGLLVLAGGIGIALACAGRPAQAQREGDRKDAPAAEAGERRTGEGETRERRAAEAEAKARRSAEAEAGARRSAEAEAGARRGAEAEARGRRPAEGGADANRRERAGREGGDDPLHGFKPQNDREAALLDIIKGLQQQVNELRQEVRQIRAGADRPRDGEAVRRGPRDGEGAARRGPRDGEGPPRTGPRDGEGSRRPGPRDGEGPPRTGPRDGERPRDPGPRDGEDAPKGTREGAKDAPRR